MTPLCFGSYVTELNQAFHNLYARVINYQCKNIYTTNVKITNVKISIQPGLTTQQRYINKLWSLSFVKLIEASMLIMGQQLYCSLITIRDTIYYSSTSCHQFALLSMLLT